MFGKRIEVMKSAQRYLYRIEKNAYPYFLLNLNIPVLPTQDVQRFSLSTSTISSLSLAFG